MKQAGKAIVIGYMGVWLVKINVLFTLPGLMGFQKQEQDRFRYV